MDLDRLYELYPFMEEKVEEATADDRFLLYLSGSGSYDLDPFLICSSHKRNRLFDVMARMVRIEDKEQVKEFRKNYEFVVYDSKYPDRVEIYKSAGKGRLSRPRYRNILEDT